MLPNNPSSLRPNFNPSSSLSAVSSTSKTAHEAAGYETKRCARATGSKPEEKCADLVAFRLAQKMKFNIASEFISHEGIMVDLIDE